MIPFEELVAALDRWRMRNGLPVVTGELPMSTSSSPATPIAGVPAWNAYAAPAASYAEAYAAPAAAPAPATRPPTDSDVLALDDADVAAEEDEALYENEGDDFAMQFSGSQAAAPAPAPAAPAPVYDEGEYGSYEDQASPEYAPPAASGEYAASGAYAEHPAYGEEHDAAGAIESEEEEEDWSKMPGFPGFSSDTQDAGDEVVDERTVVGDDHRRRDD